MTTSVVNIWNVSSVVSQWLSVTMIWCELKTPLLILVWVTHKDSNTTPQGAFVRKPAELHIKYVFLPDSICPAPQALQKLWIDLVTSFVKIINARDHIMTIDRRIRIDVTYVTSPTGSRAPFWSLECSGSGCRHCWQSFLFHSPANLKTCVDHRQTCVC